MPINIIAFTSNCNDVDAPVLCAEKIDWLFAEEKKLEIKSLPDFQRDVLK